MSDNGMAAPATAPALRRAPEGPVGAVAVPIGALAVLLSFLSVFGAALVAVCSIPALVAVVLGVIGLRIARARATHWTLAVVGLVLGLLAPAISGGWLLVLLFIRTIAEH